MNPNVIMKRIYQKAMIYMGESTSDFSRNSDFQRLSKNFFFLNLNPTN